MSVRPWRDIHRRRSRQIMVGNVPVGGDAPVTVQTMTNTPTSDARATIDQIRRCVEAGADIVRVSCPDVESTAALSRSCAPPALPIVADIHFHYKRALEAADAGAACLRINPGNIGSAERVREVVNAAKANGCAIRIGVNAGSLEKDLLEKYGEPCPEALVESALDHIKLLQDHDFHEYKVAVKASDLFLAVAAYQQLAESGGLPAPPRHHRSGRLCRRHRQERDRHRLAALVRDRRHDPVSLSAEPEEEVRGRLRDPQEPWHPQPRRAGRLLPVLRAPGFDVIRTVQALEERLSISARPCRSRCSAASSTAPARRARPTSASPAGGNGKHMVYLSGVTDHHVQDEGMVDHIVRLVEAKAARSRRQGAALPVAAE
jgi:(E)-4-hydroxy-3-methylbut-2-enyl-diphosphate synthase